MSDKWPENEARQLRAMALRCLVDHDHAPTCRDALTRDNCGACALAGRGADRLIGPNYAAWQRVYVEAGKPVPTRWRVAFWTDAMASLNGPFINALQRSLITFGCPNKGTHSAGYFCNVCRATQEG